MVFSVQSKSLYEQLRDFTQVFEAVKMHKSPDSSLTLDFMLVKLDLRHVFFFYYKNKQMNKETNMSGRNIRCKTMQQQKINLILVFFNFLFLQLSIGQLCEID